MRPAGGIRAAAFARDGARSGSRHGRSPPAETAHRRWGETAPHARRYPNRAREPAIAAGAEARLPAPAPRIAAAPARPAHREHTTQPELKTPSTSASLG